MAGGGRKVVRVLGGRSGITKVFHILECDADRIAF